MMRRRGLAVALATWMAGSAHAAPWTSTQLVDAGSSTVAQPTHVTRSPRAGGGGAWLETLDPRHGRTVWFTGGTPATTRRFDHDAGETDEPTGGMTVVGSTAVFARRDGGLGWELFAASATTGEVRPFADLAPGEASSHPDAIVTLGGGRVFAMGWTRAAGREPFVSDGTPAGTVALANVSPDTPDRIAAERAARPGQHATSIGDRVLFLADDGVRGAEPWITDGTPGGTVLLADLVPGAGGSSPAFFDEAGSPAWFAAGDGARTLWRSDGTPAGTSATPVVEPVEVLRAGSRAWVVADEGAIAGLYVTDGTGAGTTRLASTCLACPRELGRRWSVLADGRVVFLGHDAATGLEPWITDGTLAGTRLIADLAPGADDAGVTDVVAAGAVAWLFSPTETAWRTDGTSIDAVATGVVPCDGGGAPVGADVVLCAGPGGAGACDPHALRPDGSVVRLADVQPGVLSSIRPRLWSQDGLLLFEAGSVWSAPNGAEAAAPLDVPGGPWSLAGVLGPIPGGALASVFDRAWVTDGRLAGTSVLGRLAGLSQTSAALGDSILFGAHDGQLGPSVLVSSRGTDATTSILARFGRGGRVPNGFVRLGAELAFFVTDTDTTLYLTDGTAAGTRAVAWHAGGPRESDPGAGTPPAVVGPDGRIHVLLHLGGPRSLWRWEPVTGEVVALAEATGDVLVALPAGVVFLDPVAGLSVAAPDGSVVALGGSGEPILVGDEDVAVTPHGIVFPHGDAATGREVWLSDGTLAGTRALADVRPGAESSQPGRFATLAPGGPVLFAADDGVHGRELWWTDGTAAGTFLASDVVPGPESSNPWRAVIAGSKACFPADDGTGREVWCIPFANADESSACLDGEDQDADGAIDCADDDCLSRTPCAGLDPDGDGVASRDDCAPADPQAWSIPAEIDALTITQEPSGAGVLLEWPPSEPAGGAVAYDVARGLLSQLIPDGAGAECVVLALTETSWVDGASAPPGDAFYWLVKARNACGPAAGLGWGLEGLGAPPPACP